MKYRILIIDDEYNKRKKRYERIFSDQRHVFNVTATLKMNDIMYEAKRAHIALVDIMLKDDDTPLTLAGQNIVEFLNKQNPDLPIYLISGKWSKIEIETFFNYFLTKKIVGGANYTLLNNPVERGKVLFEIISQINNRQNHETLDLGKNDDLIIFHLSDFQFGGDWEGIGSNQREKYKNVILNILKSFPQNDDGSKIKPNLIIITGDIAQFGHPKEYGYAIESLEYLCEELSIAKSQRYIVPGNHDISYPLLCTHKIKYDTNKKRVTTNADDKFYTSFLLEPYKQFSQKFTGRNLWNVSFSLDEIKQKGAYYISNSFQNYGINIIGLSTVSNTALNSPDTPTLDTSCINDISEHLNIKFKSKPNNVNLFIMHHSPWKDLDNSLGKDGYLLLSEIQNSGNSIFLYGHRHKCISNLRPYTDNSKKNALYIVSPTPSLKKREPDSLRGFNIIKLKRNDDIVKKCEVEEYIYNGEEYESLKKKEYFISKEHGWVLK